jgi:hypothetical protein
LKITKVEPVTFAAKMIGNAVIRAFWLAITVNFHGTGAAFNDNWESDSLHDFDA